MMVEMDLYHTTFAVLGVACTAVAYKHHRADAKASQPSKEAEIESQTPDLPAVARRFKWTFLSVYLLVMGADWLQGPYIYTVYKDEKSLPESTVAYLFLTGFSTAAISAFFLGSLADRFGRRLACLAFCITYSLSCLTILSYSVPILFCGRVLGGISTTLMYSVFESWMVTEYYALGLERSGVLALSEVFGIMTTLNSVVAILAGVVGQALVDQAGTKTAPFLAGVGLLIGAFFIMISYWRENYGDSATAAADPNTNNNTPPASQKSTLQIILADKRILILGFISCCFEGSMYLFVFFWSAALKSSHALAHPAKIAPDGSIPTPTDLPFGVIFSSFMSGMMLGSLGFSLATAPPPSSSESGLKQPELRWYQLSSPTLLALSVSIASGSLLVPVLTRSEPLTFWAFILFEICVGIYFPSMGYQKGRIVEDGVRAKVYGLLRIPLNVFVVGALSLTIEGDAHRERVYVFCGGLLLLASMAAGAYLSNDSTEREEYEVVEDREE